MKVITLIQWRDPDDVWHEPGEIADITVADLDDLIKSGTVEPVPTEPASADPTPPEQPKVFSRPVVKAPEIPPAEPEVPNGRN